MLLAMSRVNQEWKDEFLIYTDEQDDFEAFFFPLDTKASLSELWDETYLLTEHY